MSSSSSEEHSDYSGDKVDFDDEPTLLDASKFSHISEEEMQVDVPAMVPPSGEITATKVCLLPHLLFSLYEHCFNASFESLLHKWLPVLRLRLSPILRR